MKRAVCFIIVVIIASGIILPAGATSGIDPSLIIEKISDEGKEAMEKIEIPVKLCLVSSTEENKDSVLEYFLSLLEGTSELVSTETVTIEDGDEDDLYGYAPEDINDNSVIVVSDKRSCLISDTDIYRFYVEGYGYLTYDEYQMINQMYYLSYGQNVPSRTVFSGELSVIPAAVYAGEETLPVIYALKGHGEKEVSDIIRRRMIEEKADLLSLEAGEGIPDDAEAVLINAPTYDITAEERDMLHSYLLGGGDVILLSDLLTYSASSMPNLAALASYMGMISIDGLVIEGDSERTYKSGGTEYPYIINPYVGNDSSTPVSLVKNKNLLACMSLTSCHGIEYSGKKGALFCPVISSGEKSYVKIGAGDKGSISTYEYEDGDRNGPVALGAVSVLCDGEGNFSSGAFIWYGTPSVTEQPADPVFVGMSYLFAATVRMTVENNIEINDTEIIFPEQTEGDSQTVEPAGGKNGEKSGFFDMIKSNLFTVITVIAGLFVIAVIIVCTVLFTKKKPEGKNRDKD